MPPPSFTQAFIIFRRDEKGRPVEIIPYNTDIATYVAVAISICRGMLKNSMVKGAFTNLAEDIDPALSNSWHKDMPKNDVAEMFIEKILERFPLVFLDDSLKNPSQRAVHCRRAWNDEGLGFETRKQAILINGPRVKAMCIAGKRAEGFEDPNSDEAKQFRVFLFALAKTFVHELAHVFVTFLGRGKTDTPPDVHILLDATTGEAGWYLEKLIFGGVISVYRNDAEYKEQAGTCVLINEKGTFEIFQETIDKFIRYQFNFPIIPGSPVSTSMKPLGDGFPKAIAPGDPMNAIETSQLLARHEANPFKWDKEVEQLMAKNPNPEAFSEDQQSVMHQIPFEPGLRLEAGPNPRAQVVM